MRFAYSPYPVSRRPRHVNGRGEILQCLEKMPRSRRASQDLRFRDPVWRPRRRPKVHSHSIFRPLILLVWLGYIWCNPFIEDRWDLEDPNDFYIGVLRGVYPGHWIFAAQDLSTDGSSRLPWTGFENRPTQGPQTDSNSHRRGNSRSRRLVPRNYRLRLSRRRRGPDALEPEILLGGDPR